MKEHQQRMAAAAKVATKMDPASGLSAAVATTHHGSSQHCERVCLPTTIMNGEPLPECDCNITGGSNGADALGAAQSIACGHDVAHLMAANNELGAQAKGQEQYSVTVPEAVRNHPKLNAALREAMAQRGLELTEASVKEWDASKRNALQAWGVETVYAVCYRAPMPPGCASEANIGGGTGVMHQFFINRTRPYNDATGRGGEDPPGTKLRFYLFDDTPVTADGKPTFPGAQLHAETHRRWSQWDGRKHTWIPMQTPPPAPSGRYALVGGTRLSTFGETAITGLFEGCFEGHAGE
mmetsp:Transcript_90292/g.258151  ORF Transcript_90292/g.258151 Transcript_90292/m.258151 type:complete len:295 (-) Transcript_90292:155-1039(-)